MSSLQQIIIFSFLSMIFAILGCLFIHECIHLFIHEFMNSLIQYLTHIYQMVIRY